MDDFVYHNPTKILFGKQKTELIGAETAQFGQKVMLVTGQNSLQKSGYYKLIHESLASSCKEVIEFPGIRSNPLLDKVEEGVALCKKHGVEVICGVGGGSVIDSAKAIGAGAVADNRVWTFFRGKKSIKGCLPITCVNTLAGSGSDMNSGMVLTNPENNLKIGIANKHLFPKVSILNPEITFTVSPAQTAWGCIDIISHLLEVYFSHKSRNSMIQDRLIEGLLVTVIESCNNLINRTASPFDCRSNLLWTASLALSGLTVSGLGKLSFLMHLLEHSLSGLYNIPHGKGLAAIIPGWLAIQQKENRERHDLLQKRVIDQLGLDNLSNSPESFFREWFTFLHCPTSLKDLSIADSHLDELVQNCLPVAKLWRMRHLDADTIRDYYSSCL